MTLKIAGMKRILTKNCKVIKSTIKTTGNNITSSGKIIINSQKLKHEARRRVRVIVYAVQKK